MDYFATYYSLYFDNKEWFKTKLGGFITVITFLLFFGFFLYLGQQLIEKNNPFDNLTISVSVLPGDLEFTVPIAFLIEQVDGTTQA